MKTKEDWQEEGHTFHDLKRYKEALIAYDHVIQLDPKAAEAIVY